MENSDTKDIDFEQQINNAKKLLDELNNKDITLSKSVEIYKSGLEELDKASKLLENAKLEFRVRRDNEF
jgi:exodeoxyribonuclease VII small subunit